MYSPFALDMGVANEINKRERQHESVCLVCYSLVFQAKGDLIYITLFMYDMHVWRHCWSYAREVI